MLKLTGGRFTIVNPIKHAKVMSTNEITQVNVISPEPERLFQRKPIPEIHETVQEIDIPFLITE